MARSKAMVCAMMLAASAAVPGILAQDVEVQLVKVVGCLRQDSGGLPWSLARATEGTPASAPYTSDEEVQASAEVTLGTLEYRLLGTSEFEVEPHVGHKVQAKGLPLTHEGELRLNLTSFQHLAPSCDE